MTATLTEPTRPGRTGDRLVGFTVLLPPAPRRVLLAVDPALAAALSARFPDAEVHRSGDAPRETGSIDLLVLDTRLLTADERTALESCVAPDGVCATIGDQGDLFVDPDLARPEQLRHQDWPHPRRRTSVPGVRDVVRRARAPRLSVSGAPGGSVAERIATDLTAAVGGPVELAGVLTGTHTILRYRTRGGDLAVRVSLLGTGTDLDRASRVVAAVPAIAPWVPETVAAGTTDGLRWVATRWVPAVAPRTHRRLAATTLPTVARTLAETTTGRTAPGWSLTWLAAVDLLDARTRHRLVPLLERLDDGVPTGWCHGDPWPGNVLPASPHPVVTDWDNAVADAPQGIDQLLVAAFERATTHRVDLATACHDLLELPLEARVAGREWTSWSPVERAALVVAAAVLHLRNRSVVDLDAERLEAYRETLRAIADTALPPSGSIPARAGTLGGAGWLGIGAGVVKAAQTIVLLVLAALLEPSAIGVIAIGALVLNVTSAVTDLGTATALVHWRGDAERAARSALAVAGGLALGLTAITWAAAPWMSEVLNGGDLGVTIIRGLMLCLPMYAVAAISQELLRRDLAFKRRVVPDVVGAVVGALVSIGLAYAGAGAISLVIGQLVQAFLVMALCWVVRPPVLPGWVPTDVRALLAYGFHLAGAAVLQLLMLNVDYLMVANRLGAEQLGIYSMAFRLGYMPYLLVGVVIAGAAFAHLCRIRGPELGRAVGETMLRTLAIVVPLYVGMILLAPQLTLLGTQWEPGVPALRWLAAYGIVLSVLGLAIVALNAAGHTRDGFWLTLLHLVLLAGLLQVWVDRGVEMVAVAQLVAGAASLVVAAIALQRRIAGLQWWTMARRSLPILVGVAGMVAVELGLAQLLPWARVSYVGLLIIGSATLLAYLVPLLSLDRHRLLPVPTIRGRRR